MGQGRKRALGVAEDCADALVTAEELELARREAVQAYKLARREQRLTASSLPATLAVGSGSHTCEMDINRVLHAVGGAAMSEGHPGDPTRLARAHLNQVPLLRCILGNPFRPVALDPRWRTSTVVALAEGVYADRAFDRLPVLADALEDAGCGNDDLLSHRSGDGPHARGCWALGLILGKQ